MQKTDKIHKILKSNGYRLEGFERNDDGTLSPVVTDAKTGEQVLPVRAENIAAPVTVPLDMMPKKDNLIGNNQKYGEPPFDEKVSTMSALKTRTRKILAAAGVVTLGDLVGYTPLELGKVAGIGKGSLEEIRIAVAERGLSLAMWENPKQLLI